MSDSEWERILPSGECCSDLQILRNDKIAHKFFGVRVPVLKCVSFFPGKSPANVLESLCDIKRRVAWDVNYRPYTDDTQALPSQKNSLQSLFADPLRTLCHKVQLPSLNSIGMKGRLFCYDRLITPLLGGKSGKKAVLSNITQDSDIEGYSVSFRHRDASTVKNLSVQGGPKPTEVRIFFQQYIIRKAQRGERIGTELTMTTCTDISLPRYFPRALQNYISSHFTTQSFINLREYLEKAF